MNKINLIISKKIKLAKLYEKYLSNNKLIKLPITKKCKKCLLDVLCKNSKS